MEDIEQRWGSLQLTYEEDRAIDNKDDEEEVRKQCDLYLIEKVWMDRTIGKGLLESKMARV